MPVQGELAVGAHWKIQEDILQTCSDNVEETGLSDDTNGEECSARLCERDDTLIGDNRWINSSKLHTLHMIPA